MDNISIGTPSVLEKVHWGNSANVLCNYMKEPEYLEMILQNKAIIPRYVIEPLQYLGIPNLNKIAFPMTCFCDIPFVKTANHMFNYGRYGIALDKQTVIDKFKVQPIHYINEQSPLALDFREAFSKYFQKSRPTGESSVLINYLLSTLMYMKPIKGMTEINGESKIYVFQDECEWRYIPTDHFPKELEGHLVLKQSESTEKGKDAYSKALKKHKETWLHFEWSDIRYLIVPNEPALNRLINTIKELPLGDTQKYMLISKIEVASRFSEDWI